MKMWRFFALSKARCRSFNVERSKSSRAIKVDTTKFKVMIDCSLSTRLSEVMIMFLDEEDQEQWAGCDFLNPDE